MRLITISGKAGAGKDTVAKMLQMIERDRVGFKVVSFGDTLKRVCAELTGTHLDLWYDREFKEMFSHKIGAKPRDYMQRVGDALRSVNPRVFIDATLNRIAYDGSYIIPDARRVNEIDAVHDKGGFSIRVNRPGIFSGDHVTETELDNYPKFHYVIVNDGDLHELYRETERAYESFCLWYYNERKKYFYQ